MSTLIVYSTKYGTTERCARALAEMLGGEVELRNLKKDRRTPDWNEYSRVIVGSSVYVGKVSKETTEFCTRYAEQLAGKDLGLFICCMREGDIAQAELADAFPESLRRHARACDYFGGEIVLSRLNTLDRLMARKAAKIEEDISTLDPDKITRFLEILKTAG